MKRTRLLFALIAFIAIIVMFATLRSKEGITEKECKDHGGTYLPTIPGATTCLKWLTTKEKV